MKKNKIIIVTRSQNEDGSNTYSGNTEMYKRVFKENNIVIPSPEPHFLYTMWVSSMLLELSSKDISTNDLNEKIRHLNSLDLKIQLTKGMIGGDTEKEYRESVVKDLSNNDNNPYRTFILRKDKTGEEYEVTLLLWNLVKPGMPLKEELVKAIIADCEVPKLSPGCENYLYIHDKEWDKNYVGIINNNYLKTHFTESRVFRHIGNTFFDHIKNLEIPCKDTSLRAMLEKERKDDII